MMFRHTSTRFILKRITEDLEKFFPKASKVTMSNPFNKTPHKHAIQQWLFMANIILTYSNALYKQVILLHATEFCLCDTH